MLFASHSVQWWYTNQPTMFDRSERLGQFSTIQTHCKVCLQFFFYSSSDWAVIIAHCSSMSCSANAHWHWSGMNLSPHQHSRPITRTTGCAGPRTDTLPPSTTVHVHDTPSHQGESRCHFQFKQAWTQWPTARCRCCMNIVTRYVTRLACCGTWKRSRLDARHHQASSLGCFSWP